MKNILKNFFGLVDNVVDFFKSLFGEKAGEFYLEFMKKIAPMVNTAYPIVKKIAELTPTRTDDMILAAYEAMGFKDFFQSVGENLVAQKEALRNLAKLALKDSIPNKEMEDWILNTIVEMAYSRYKVDQIAAQTSSKGPIQVLEKI